MDVKTTTTLNNGVRMPVLGLGVWKIADGEKTVNSVLAALDAGYRYIDTASAYENEKGVGEGFRRSKILREDVFITTKLWNTDHNIADKALSISLKKLGLDYVDQYLIHWPVEKQRQKTWKTLEKLYSQGLCRSIGVSNYTIQHIEELLSECDIIPAVNQVEFTPFLYQRELFEYCGKKNIQLVCYSPLTEGKRLSDPALVEVAQRYGKSTAQVLIRWCLQHGLVAIPKSENPKHIRENAQVFDFNMSDEDMGLLDSLDEGYRLCWNPSNIP